MRRTAAALEQDGSPSLASAHGQSTLRHYVDLLFALLNHAFQAFGGSDDHVRNYTNFRAPYERPARRPRKRLKLCLAASGGGHLRQLLDMEPFWIHHDYFFVTEQTSLGRSISARYPTSFLPHFALGQARLGKPFAMLAMAFKSVFLSFAIIARQRPDLVVTTGAGSMLFVVACARFFGARVILIDSFARFEGPSTFARVMGPMANVRIAQSQRVADEWQTPHAFNPFTILDQPRPIKEPLLFATVGATLPFDRLVDTVVEAKQKGLLPEDVIIQTGDSLKRIHHQDGLRIYDEIPFAEVGAILRRADIVVCHGGTGSLITALQNHCRVIAIPRRFHLAEHYDDHQLEVTRNLREQGLIELVDEQTDFASALRAVRASTPRAATLDPKRLNAFLADYVEQTDFSYSA